MSHCFYFIFCLQVFVKEKVSSKSLKIRNKIKIVIFFVIINKNMLTENKNKNKDMQNTTLFLHWKTY